MADLPGRGPKYLRIADALRTQIKSGDLKPGDRTPPETAMLKRFGVSLPTLRQAIGVLRAEGLIESRQGIGTFVKEDRRLQRRSRGRYGRARHDEKLLASNFEHDIVSAGQEPAPDHIASQMGLEPGDSVVVRRRHLRDREFNRLEEIGASYLPSEFAAGTHLEEPAVVPKALFLCVEELTGKRFEHARDEWLARPASVDEAEAFDIPTGTPVLNVLHVARAEDGAVLEVSTSVWPADRVVVIDEYDITSEAEIPSAESDL